MSTTKVINHLSVDNLNLNEVLTTIWFLSLMEVYSGFLFLIKKKSTRW